MSVYDKIFSSSPVNKQAAMVTSSSSEDPNERKYLVAKAQHLQAAIKSAKQHRNMQLVDVQAMGRELQAINAQLKSLKVKEGFLRSAEIPRIFMDECRRRMSKPMFDEIMKEVYAIQRELQEQS